LLTLGVELQASYTTFPSLPEIRQKQKRQNSTLETEGAAPRANPNTHADAWASNARSDRKVGP